MLGIERLATEDGDDCDYRRKKSLYLASKARDQRTLEEEYKARRRAGIVVDFLSSRDIGERFSFQRPAALLSHLAGEVDAFRLTHKLIARAGRLGLEAYDRTFVVKLDASGDAVELHTGDGHRIQARRVVFATGYFDNPNYLHVPGEDLPHVAHYFLEGHRYWRQRVVVIGAGNSSVDAALECWRAGATVTLVHFGEGFDRTVKAWVLPDITNRVKEGSIAVSA